ncbi:MAG TPA: hypothetical protein VFR58_17395 [Flavisolibacter sp.]|nr:hypothetical protein [Flavisolibacter sp.]
MKKEFITERGRVLAEDGVLRIRNIKMKSRDGLYFAILNLIILFWGLERGSDAKPMIYGGVIGLALWVLIYIAEYFILNDWRNTIDLRQVKYFKVYQETGGLETVVMLSLQSGRKKIVFRTRENQHEPFIELISAYTNQLYSLSA